MSTRKFNVTPDNVKSFLPLPNARLVVHHIHPGNSPDRLRTIRGGKVSPYITKAKLVLETVRPDGSIAKRVLASANAICAPGDHPNRQLSYRIAAGRVMRAYWGRNAKV